MLKTRFTFMLICTLVVGVTSLVLPSVKVIAAPIGAGDDVFNSEGEITILTFANPFGIPVFLPETISLDSMGMLGTVHRDDQMSTTIDTEIISMDLFGNSANVGAVHVRVGTGNGVALASIGQITNVVQDPLDPGFADGLPSSFQSGDSFFDVFYEIDVGGITLFNTIPHRLGPETIFELPPIGIDYLSPGSLNLFVKGDATMTVVGQISDIRHTPVPEPSTYALFAFGLGALGIAHRRKLRKARK